MYDPEADSAYRAVPTIPWPSQVEFARWMQERRAASEDAFLKKSRKIGISWTVLQYILWCFIFEPGFKCLIGSRAEYSVDNRGDMNALFPKLRFLLDLLPDHIRPEVVDVFMKIESPETGAVITGQSANRQFGASGRVSLIFMDEAARLDSPMAARIWEATESVGPRLFVFNAPDSRGHFVCQQMAQLPARMCMHLTWRANPHAPEDFPELMTVPRGSLTRSQFDQSYEGIDGAGKIGLILSASEAVNGYGDGELVEGERETLPLFVSWDHGSGFRKQVAVFLLLRMGPEPQILVDLVVSFGRIPFCDPTGRDESCLDIVDRIIRTDYGRERAVFHTGDSSGGQRESTQLSRIEYLRGYESIHGGYPMEWQEQQEIVDPHNTGGQDFLHLIVNQTPWKLKIIEEITQPMLNAGTLRMHRTRASEALEAANEWAWDLPKGLNEHEAGMVSKAQHRMGKAASSDRAEPAFIYGPFAVIWWLNQQRMTSEAPAMPPQEALDYIGESAALSYLGA
jgi:hypothetical protein